LTAAHNVVGTDGPIISVRITHPGRARVHPSDVIFGKVESVTCAVIGPIYKRNGPLANDIAILDAAPFKSANYLRLSAHVPPLNAVVDVIGYPDEIRQEWINTHGMLINPDKSREEILFLFQNGHLTVTRGTVETAQRTISYQISTCPGLSGSCVLYKGFVIGECNDNLNAYEIGVHIGQVDKSPNGLPMAVPFTGRDVIQFLDRMGIGVGLETNS
jgi:hypothetical protein